MPEHLRQHYIPKSYLKAWCDPGTPYVWRFEKEARIGIQKSLKKIFFEQDMYTIRATDGGRDLRLEHGLSSLENEFVRVRETILAERQAIDDASRFLLCAFTSAAHARTVASRDHWRAQWQKVVEMGDTIEESVRRNPNTRIPMPMSGQYGSDGLTHDEVRNLAREPLQHMLWVMIEGESKGLYLLLKLAILEAEEGSSFITSDAPCIWFDPEARTRPPMFQSPGLAYESLEITFPISPRQTLFFSHKDFQGYRSFSARMVEELNRRSRFFAHKYYVSHMNHSKDRWFSADPEPPSR